MSLLIAVNYATSNVFWQLQDKKITARNTRFWDYHSLMLLLPFFLYNLLKFCSVLRWMSITSITEALGVGVCRSPAIDPSGELIGVTNVFLHWYKLLRKIMPGKTPSDIVTLLSLSTGYVSFIAI